MNCNGIVVNVSITGFSLPESTNHSLYETETNFTLNELSAKFRFRNASNPVFWEPECEYNASTAIIIPFRDRMSHLTRFLNYMHPFLRRQNIAYQIFIINQVDSSVFNRAKLMNVGYKIASALLHFTCYIFHDIDLLPLNDQLQYTCYQDGPFCMAASQDRFNWRLPYKGYCGGVVAMTQKQMRRTNGFPNKYWGWGGEDDEIAYRFKWSGQEAHLEPETVTLYASMTHERDERNPVNEARFKLLREAVNWWTEDGINHLNYSILQMKPKQTYFYVAVHLKQ